MHKLLLSLLALAFTFSVAAAEFNPDRIVVKMKEGVQLPKLDFAKRVHHLFGDLYVIYLNDSKSFNKSLPKIEGASIIQRDFFSGRKSMPETIQVDPNTIEEKGGAVFNDPKASKQWHLRLSSNGMSVEKAYKELINDAGTEIIVAVVDTGVDYNHEDLKEVMWTNPGEIAGNGIDDDANGYIDDVHGINTLTRDGNGNASGDMRDTHSHGTHVSGIIGAKQNNGVGVAGVAGNVKIIGIRTVPNNGDELDVDVAESFIYAAKNGAKVINCSFGKAHNEGGMVVAETIKHIGETYGTLVIAAAGNSSQDIDSRLTYPASFETENLMVIASTTSRGGMSYFSNYGKKNVDLAAPGSSVYSTTPNNRYAGMSGTSMAAPAAAGVAAAVLSQNPDLTPLELKTLLMDTTTKIGRFSGKMVSGGRIDLFNALK